jgi:hypothetical protein
MTKQGPKIPAGDAVARVSDLLFGWSGTMGGGALSAWKFNKPFAYSDVDVFVPSEFALARTVQFMLDHGAVMDEENSRTMERWSGRGTGDWHTNSVRLELLNDEVEVNVVYKIVDKRPLRTHTQVVESFDFSNLTHSIDLRTGKEYDLFDHLFRGEDPSKVRLLPDREWQWLNAKVGKFTGIRQGERYAKNVSRGYDLELVKAPIIQGYRYTAAHYMDGDDPVELEHAEAYTLIADLIEDDDIDGLLTAYKGLKKHDPAKSLIEGMKKP